MDKRSFIKFLSAIVAGPIVSPLFAKLPDSKLKNWAGNLEYGTENLYSATSVDQVRQFIKTQKKLKVLGTRHCFNNIADTSTEFLSLKPQDKVIALDPKARTVTLEAGSVKLASEKRVAVSIDEGKLGQHVRQRLGGHPSRLAAAHQARLPLA